MTAVARRVDAPRRRAGGAPRTGSNPVRRSHLRVLPRPRAAANTVFVLVGFIGVLMLAAVVLHTRLAERQLEIDRREEQVVAARERFDVLRQQRAELRSPTRLTVEAASLGMQPATETEFLEVVGATAAEVIVAGGDATGEVRLPEDDDPLDQIRRVREAART